MQNLLAEGETVSLNNTQYCVGQHEINDHMSYFMQCEPVCEACIRMCCNPLREFTNLSTRSCEKLNSAENLTTVYDHEAFGDIEDLGGSSIAFGKLRKFISWTVKSTIKLRSSEIGFD